MVTCVERNKNINHPLQRSKKNKIKEKYSNLFCKNLIKCYLHLKRPHMLETFCDA